MNEALSVNKIDSNNSDEQSNQIIKESCAALSWLKKQFKSMQFLWTTNDKERETSVTYWVITGEKKNIGVFEIKSTNWELSNITLSKPQLIKLKIEIEAVINLLDSK